MSREPWIFQMAGGIGDMVWCARKLVNFPEPWGLEVSCDEPRRGLPFAKLLPQCRSARYGTFKATMRHPQGVYDRLPEKPGTYYTDANTVLHDGRSLADYLKELPDSPYFEMLTAPAEQSRAKSLLDGVARPLGVFCSSWSNAKSFRVGPEAWEAIVVRLVRETGATPIFLGTDWDASFTWEVVARYRRVEPGNPGVVVLQEDLGTIVELIRRLRYLVGFQSGLNILAASLRVPTCLVYLPHIASIHPHWRPADQDARFCSAALTTDAPAALADYLLTATVLPEVLR